MTAGAFRQRPTLHVREYGESGPPLLVLHGGPGAPGYVAPVARGLSDSFSVLEPLQRGSGGEPLTVAQHVADLHDVVESRLGEAQPSLVGHSWGAMLALAYGAAHPARVGPFVLIGCGTFDAKSRQRMKAIREERMDDRLRRRIADLPEESPDPDERLGVLGELLMPIESYDLIDMDPEFERYDARANRESWDDMIRLQEEGTYPAAFAAIESPVLMLHGAVDPHPGQMIRGSLEPYLPQLEYVEWERCGHYPWLERQVRDDFFAVLRSWLATHLNVEVG